VRNLIIGATRNWSKTVIEWNLSSNPELKPHTDNGGCDRCLGAVTIDKDNVTRNPAYYIIAHAGKYVRPGSVRIASNDNGVLRNVAFKTPSGSTVLIVLNDGKEATSFDVAVNKKQSFTATLNAGAMATYVW
jgi:glucosylceramidase